jgi:hypothetical protein
MAGFPAFIVVSFPTSRAVSVVAEASVSLLHGGIQISFSFAVTDAAFHGQVIRLHVCIAKISEKGVFEAPDVLYHVLKRAFFMWYASIVVGSKLAIWTVTAGCARLARFWFLSTHIGT